MINVIPLAFSLAEIMQAAFNPLELPDHVNKLSAHFIELERRKKLTAARPNWYAAI